MIAGIPLNILMLAPMQAANSLAVSAVVHALIHSLTDAVTTLWQTVAFSRARVIAPIQTAKRLAVTVDG